MVARQADAGYGDPVNGKVKTGHGAYPSSDVARLPVCTSKSWGSDRDHWWRRRPGISHSRHQCRLPFWGRSRITHDDATALLRGQPPTGRADLDCLAATVAEFRRAWLSQAPQPSAALAARPRADQPTDALITEPTRSGRHPLDRKSLV
jgi:hypothetical protein